MSTLVAIQLLAIAQNFTFYATIIIFIAGMIGNILNICIFTKMKTFQGNRCAFYLIVESIVSLCFLIQMFILQMYQITYGIDPGNISIFYCKIRTTLGQSSRLLIDYIVCFEAFDQYLTTHHRFFLRKLSTLKLAQYLIIVASILCILQTIPYIIFYDIVSSFGCIITNNAYRNVRRLVRRQISIVRRKLDHQLTAMIFVRVIFFIILLLPYTMYRIYILNVNIPSIDRLPYAIVQLISAITISLMLGNHAVNFYVFFITSSRFRRQVKYFFMKICFQSFKRWFNSNMNRIHPLNIPSTQSSAALEL
ncbi:unnamed protein product [Rotaria sp. Silwood1]|nr:unnamed protein product [Rotaria sp. Silwood1]